MSTEIECELTGYACECCVLLHYNGECSHDYDDDHAGDCSRDYMLTGSYALDVDLEHVHFGYDCIVCNDHALAGTRYDVTLTVWK